MSPFGFHHKDRLAQPPLNDPVPGSALAIRGDPGYSAMEWWTASIRLQVATDGHAPTTVDHDGPAVREKTPFTGLELPVDVEREDPATVRVRWDEVPTIEQRIAKRDPLIFDPERTWRAVVAADPTQADQQPSWRESKLVGWPADGALRHGHRPGTALVIARSGDPSGHMSGSDFSPPGRTRYSYGGTIETGWHTYLGWLLLCVIPEDGERYGLYLRTKINRARCGPVLPVAIHPSKPDDLEIAWDYAPEVEVKEQSQGEQLADAVLSGGHVMTGADAASDTLAGVENPIARKLAGRLARRGAVVVVSGPDLSGPGAGGAADRDAKLAELQQLRARGVLDDEEYQQAAAKLGAGD